MLGIMYMCVIVDLIIDTCGTLQIARQHSPVGDPDKFL
jgi:hypothetical protein